MIYKERQYQMDAAKALYKVVSERPEKNPVIAVPTGAGKTIIMCLFLQLYLEKYKHDKVVVLSHTQEILHQDYEAICKFFPDMEIGLYSSGLDSRTSGQITVAGIQSIYNKRKEMAWTNLYLIDEVHAVSHKSQGMYRTLLDRSAAIKCGMSATLYRSGHGYIYEKNKLFDYLAYDLTSFDNFNKLVDDGYLTKLVSVSTKTEMDSTKVKKSAGDFNVKSLAETFDKESITKEAVNEAIKYGEGYNKWLVFAIDIDHADNINEELKKHGIISDVLHSRMSEDRSTVIDRFVNGDLRAVVSVGMITTGFDAPNIDLIILLRPTMSAVLHVQMVGRGLRIYPGKDHCLVLDFAGNTARLGPINEVKVPKQPGEGGGEAPTKTCPKCSCIIRAAAKECNICNHVFVFKTKLEVKPSSADIVKKSKETQQKWLPVKHVQYGIHDKIGKPDSMLVVYHCGEVSKIKEWIHIELTNYAGRKSAHWAHYRGYNGPPSTRKLFEYSNNLKKPTKILVDFSDKYPVIVNAIF